MSQIHRSQVPYAPLSSGRPHPLFATVPLPHVTEWHSLDAPPAGFEADDVLSTHWLEAGERRLTDEWLSHCRDRAMADHPAEDTADADAIFEITRQIVSHGKMMAFMRGLPQMLLNIDAQANVAVVAPITCVALKHCTDPRVNYNPLPSKSPFLVRQVAVLDRRLRIVMDRNALLSTPILVGHIPDSPVERRVALVQVDPLSYVLGTAPGHDAGWTTVSIARQIDIALSYGDM